MHSLWFIVQENWALKCTLYRELREGKSGNNVWMQFADFEVIICWVFVYAALLEKLFPNEGRQRQTKLGRTIHTHNMQKQHGEKCKHLVF